jgi:hypothetical protein
MLRAVSTTEQGLDLGHGFVDSPARPRRAPALDELFEAFFDFGAYTFNFS